MRFRSPRSNTETEPIIPIDDEKSNFDVRFYVLRLKAHQKGGLRYVAKEKHRDAL